MVESIRGQGFAYAREVEEDRAKELVKTRAKRKLQIAAAAADRVLFLKSSRQLLCPGIYWRRACFAVLLARGVTGSISCA
jgi:hypothetical protein